MKSLMLFIPLLIIYTINTLIFNSNELDSDEIRYVMFANNLVNGFYTEASNPNLMNGPGFPLYLAAYLKLGLPLIVPKLVNGLLIVFSVFFLYESLLYYVSKKAALLAAYCFGLYLPMFKWIRLNFSEAISMFLICGFMYFMIRLLTSERFRVKDLIIPAFLLGYLVLVKTIFAYAIYVALLLSILYFLLYRTQKSAKNVAVFVLSLVVTIPFLIYTYSVTGRVMYWGSNGGEQLYWMTTRYDNEYGHWIDSDHLLLRRIPDMHPSHIALYDSVYNGKRSWVEMNDMFMHQAVENIKLNPKAYLYNIVANTMRMVADGPLSYKYQSLRPYLYLLVNALLIVPLFFSLYPAWKHRKSIPFEIITLSVFILLYVGGSALLAAIHRYFILVIPYIIFWLAFMYSNFIQISFKNNFEDTPTAASF